MNARGRSIIELCIGSGVVIANGRMGDMSPTASWTYVSRTGRSVVDYLLASPEDLKIISDFELHHRIESDHMPISFSVDIPRAATVESQGRIAACKQQQPRLVWNPAKADEYRNQLQINRPIYSAELDVNSSCQYGNQNWCTVYES